MSSLHPQFTKKSSDFFRKVAKKSSRYDNSLCLCDLCSNNFKPQKSQPQRKEGKYRNSLLFSLHPCIFFAPYAVRKL